MGQTALIDTNVASDLEKVGALPLSQWNPNYWQFTSPVVSFMTVAELHFWAESRRWGQRRKLKLQAIIDHLTVLDFDLNLCRLWAQIRAQRRRAGKPMSSQDAWIAATAILYKQPLITRNVKDFAWIDGLEVLQPAD